jgi:Nif-specific regulatory protein
MDINLPSNINLDKVKILDKEQFQGLYKISQILNSATYEETLLQDSLDIVIRHINAERGLCARYFENKNNFEILSARNLEEESITNLSKFSAGILQKVLTQKQPCLFHDVQADPNFSQYASIQIQGIKSVIGVPIIRDGKIWGVIIADSRLNRKEFTEENLIFLDFFSNLVALALDRIEKIQSLKDENEILINKLKETYRIPEIIGDSTAMKQLGILIHKVAQTDATVLLQGESGTGKDLIASAIHQLSNRKDKPFFAQFCGSIPDTLLESELFGYKKGAFTGANTDKKGLFEIANKGTFFLDEIADISPALQAKLLRVIQNKEIIRLGDTETIKIDVRIIAATNKDLKVLMKEEKFREDLFYRLNVFPISIPPLRERKGDMPLLANHFINKISGKEIKLDKSAIKKLENYYWPGNVRQLENVIQRAIIMCESSLLEEEHIVYEEDEDLKAFSGTLEDYTKLILKKRLQQFDSNRTLTAKSLGVSVRWVQQKLKDFNLELK